MHSAGDVDFVTLTRRNNRGLSPFKKPVVVIFFLAGITGLRCIFLLKYRDEVGVSTH